MKNRLFAYIVALMLALVPICAFGETVVDGVDQSTSSIAETGDSATAFFSSGTIEHEYGGLESNVSAYSGLLAISGGSTSEVDALSELNAQIADATLIDRADKFTGGVTIQTSDGTTTPDVSNAALGYNNIYESDDNGTVTNFDDGDDESEFSNGDWFIFLITDASTTVDFSTGTAIEGNAGVDFTGHADYPTPLLFIYENARWNCTNLLNGMSDPTTLALASITGTKNYYDAAPDGMSDDDWNGDAITGINFGETAVQWACVFLAADGKVDIADADAAGEFPAIGIVAAGGDDTGAATILTRGVVRNEGWTGLTVGAAIYLSDDGAGGITETAPSTSGDCVQIVGRAISDSEIYFNFSGHWLEVE